VRIFIGQALNPIAIQTPVNAHKRSHVNFAFDAVSICGATQFLSDLNFKCALFQERDINLPSKFCLSRCPRAMMDAPISITLTPVAIDRVEGQF
jgi:hypothetical protein